MYVCKVLVDSTKNPKPDPIAEGTPVIVTVLPVPAPFAIVTVVPLGVSVAVVAAILSIAACPVLPCGLVAGKLVWLAIAIKPPTSSIRSTIRALIAAVVATCAFELDHVSPLAIVSVESCLKYLASDSVSVKYLLSRVPSSICVVVIVPLAILPACIVPFAMCWLSIDPSA